MMLLLIVSLVSADVYMHNPRGANDRNCERNVNRNNGNLLYDTQNNAKGGYACPRAVAANNAALPIKGMTPRMEFEVGSKLDVEWTSQHGCGVPKEAGSPGQNNPDGGAIEVPNVHCEMTIQMMCTSTLDPTGALGNMLQGTAEQYAAAPREGIPNSNGDAATNRIATTDPGQAAATSTGATTANIRYGVHETPAMYNECNRVARNRGLFTADQNVNRRSAIGTRQNPNGGRRGLECPEERDYYPYWRPTGMIDVAYLVDDPARCGVAAVGAGTTENTPLPLSAGACGGWSSVNKGLANNVITSAAVPIAPCIGTAMSGDWVGNAQGTGNQWHSSCLVDGAIPKTNAGLGAAARRLYNRREWPATAQACAPLVAEAEGSAVIWATQMFTAGFATGAANQPNAQAVKDTANLGAQCKTLDYSRSNHLGNSGVGDTATRFQMTIPPVIAATGAAKDSCVLRLRYNMSSSDYVRSLNSSLNGQASPIKQDPLVKVGPLDTDYAQLALNTNQVARTFQDRSYVFSVIPATVVEEMLNVNVRGKRGNIVQCYPSVEYDFIPNKIEADSQTVLAFQWLGSDYNPRRGCNDGEGGPYRGDNNVATGLTANTAGSNQNSRVDRMTLLAVANSRQNYPVSGATLPVGANSLFQTAKIARKFAFANAQEQLKDLDLVPQALDCLTNTQIEAINNENRRENHPRNCAEGNAISPYFATEKINLKEFVGGSQVIQAVSARNNNFSNRDTKITIKYYQGTKPGNSGGTTTVIAPPASTPLGSVIQVGLMDQVIAADPFFVDNQETDLVTDNLQMDIPGFDPVENDDYGSGALEGCTQEMMMFGGYAPTPFSITNLMVCTVFSVAYMLL